MMTEKEKEYVCDKLCKYADCAEKFDTDYAWQEYMDEKCKHCMSDYYIHKAYERMQVYSALKGNIEWRMENGMNEETYSVYLNGIKVDYGLPLSRAISDYLENPNYKEVILKKEEKPDDQGQR